jgi:hypothetical protein
VGAAWILYRTTASPDDSRGKKKKKKSAFIPTMREQSGCDLMQGLGRSQGRKVYSGRETGIHRAV